MSMCIVCNQRTTHRADRYCSDACYFVTEDGVAAIKAKHALKEAQRAARSSLLATSMAAVGGLSPAARAELGGYANDDDGVDR